MPSGRYVARLARHALVDAFWAPIAEALASGNPRAVFRTSVTVPATRIAALVHYKLFLARRGSGRPIPKRTWDFEYSGSTWDGLDSVDALPGNMAIVGFVRRLWTAPRVLDIGCGSGALAEALQVIPGLSYMGIDLSDVAISRARARGVYGATFQQGAMEEWRPTQQYDAIIFNECLYYVLEPLTVLLRYLDALSPDGALIVSIWRSGNYELIWGAIQRAFEIIESTTVEAGGIVRDIKVVRGRPSGQYANP